MTAFRSLTDIQINISILENTSIGQSIRLKEQLSTCNIKKRRIVLVKLYSLFFILSHLICVNLYYYYVFVYSYCRPPSITDIQIKVFTTSWQLWSLWQTSVERVS